MRSPEMFGQKLIHHFSLRTASSLVLRPKTVMQVGLTRLAVPDGFKHPTPRIPSERAFAISVHLRRPGQVKGWGSWVDGKFHPINFWDMGGIEIFDMESDPIGLRQSGFESVHIHIPRTTIDHFTSTAELPAIQDLTCDRGVRDEVLLHWTRFLLPYFAGGGHLPQVAADEMVSMLCGHIEQRYRASAVKRRVQSGGLAIWQQTRAEALLSDNLDGELGLPALAAECGLSPSHFARAFKVSFGVPVHRYLILKRLEIAKNLLRFSKNPLAEIALEAGFSDQPAFNRAFRTFVGTAPGQWRREFQPSIAF